MSEASNIDDKPGVSGGLLWSGGRNWDQGTSERGPQRTDRTICVK